jgi:adenylate cyclase
MGADEVGTLKGLTERRAILDRIIGGHGGRIANTAGDSVLAETDLLNRGLRQGF